METHPPTIKPLPTCTHGDDDAIHAELLKWAQEWAEKLHVEAPPASAGLMAHIEHEMRRYRGDEVMRTCPERLRACPMANRGFVARRLHDIHEESADESITLS